MKTVLYNAIRCKHCGDVIESRHRHDYVFCSCGACAVDGGHDYLRRAFKPDWLLIYQIIDNELILLLSRTGRHCDVF